MNLARPRPLFAFSCASLLALGALTRDAAAANANAKSPSPEPENERVGFFESLLPMSFQKRPAVRYNVYTEMTPEGRRRAEAAPADATLYYTAPAGTLAQVGWQPAAGEKAPPWEQLQKSMEEALAGNGFLPVNDAHPRPDLLIVFNYGSHGTDIATLAINPPDAEVDANLPVFPPPVGASELVSWIFKDPKATEDVLERARFIGGNRVANALYTALREEANNARMNATVNRTPGIGIQLPVSPDFSSPFQILLNTSDPATRNAVELAFHTCYFVTATAYDFAGVEKKQKIPLWQTRMTIEAQGVELREVLRPLIANGGPFLGRETPEAVTVQRRLDRAGRVDIGEATVVRDNEPTSTSAPAPASTPPPAPAPANTPATPNPADAR